MVETEAGDLWMNGSSGITHVSAAELTRWLRDPAISFPVNASMRWMDFPGSPQKESPSPRSRESRDGRIWFATTRGIAWLDPATLHKNATAYRPRY